MVHLQLQGGFVQLYPFSLLKVLPASQFVFFLEKEILLLAESYL
jgi:hypothetical protein